MNFKTSWILGVKISDDVEGILYSYPIACELLELFYDKMQLEANEVWYITNSFEIHNK